MAKEKCTVSFKHDTATMRDSKGKTIGVMRFMEPMALSAKDKARIRRELLRGCSKARRRRRR
jgi:hypothetical protein